MADDGSDPLFPVGFWKQQQFDAHVNCTPSVAPQLQEPLQKRVRALELLLASREAELSVLHEDLEKTRRLNDSYLGLLRHAQQLLATIHSI